MVEEPRQTRVTLDSLQVEAAPPINWPSCSGACPRPRACYRTWPELCHVVTPSIDSFVRPRRSFANTPSSPMFGGNAIGKAPVSASLYADSANREDHNCEAGADQCNHGPQGTPAGSQRFSCFCWFIHAWHSFPAIESTSCPPSWLQQRQRSSSLRSQRPPPCARSDSLRSQHCPRRRLAGPAPHARPGQRQAA